MCERMNSLAFKAPSKDNLYEKEKTYDSSKTEIRGKVFKAETSESSEAETTESVKGQFTKSLEGKDCQPSGKEISQSSQKDANRFPVEQLRLSRDSKSMEGEANGAKVPEAPTKDRDSFQKVLSEFLREDAIQFSEGRLCLSKASKSTDEEANESKSTESPEEDSASSQEDTESSEGFTSDFSSVSTSSENAASISEGETLSSNGTSAVVSYEVGSRSSKGLSCSDSSVFTCKNSSKSPSRSKDWFRRKISKLWRKVSRGMKGVFKCCLVPKVED
uniref:Uncharacterized protein n=1 Tax=Tetraodon nigroviridis TaxID=99883 RepID=H3C1E1_TETNG